ncbi:tRNA (guanine-N1)-methyltransferase [Archaeoglobus sp.]|uniref:tRNA (guanine-N1)-methyltransferase n=1 Tax=Archaeoglobus sp. TaxID=1872626 RepID=UPI0024ABE370|nr:tRNA (guanine-N1)-methyltransferase [Archaeoglobus sp.]MDI3497605.1 tRNA (adenine9-N1/guanine9-N1)-methyltransferase [Archaeoglobus sp.]
MRLKDVFVSELARRGVSRVGTRLKKVMSSPDPIARMALYVANGKADVCKSDGGLQHSFTLDGQFVDLPPDAYVGKCRSDILLTRYELTKHTFPYVVVDCRFFDEHSEKERWKIELQVKQTLGIVREYMWDEKLVVTYRNVGFGKYYPSTEEFLREKGIERVVLLDPNGDELYRRTGAECFIIGGIVDKSGTKKGYTSRIGRALERKGVEVDYRRIELRGDTVGVPDRINHIAEILLRVELDGEDVESAIKAVQPPLVAKWRLRKELHEKTVRVCVGERVVRVVEKGAFDEFREWLNITMRDFYDVCREQKFFVVSEKVMGRIKASEWDERRRCFRLNHN